MDKFGDKEYRGYTWEVTEEVRDTKSRYIIEVAPIEKPDEYFSVLSHYIPKYMLKSLDIPVDSQTGEPTEQWIKRQIDFYETGSDGFGIDEYNFGINELNRLDSIEKELKIRHQKFTNILILFLTIIQILIATVGLYTFQISHIVLTIIAGIFLMEAIIIYIYVHNSKDL